MTHGPRLLFIVNDPAFFLSHRLPLAIEAQKRGFEVHIATAPGSAVAEITPLFPHWSLPLSRCGTSLFRELQTLRFFYQLYRKVQPQLVHLVTIKPVLYGGLAARVANVPSVVAAIPGLGSAFIATTPWQKVKRRALVELYRQALRHPHCAVIFQNSENRDLFLKKGLATPQQSHLIRGAGVDMSQFHPTPLTQSKQVLLPSRMLWEKGVGDFVQAAQLLKNWGSSLQLKLVGPEDDQNPHAVPLDTLKRWNREGPVEWKGFQKDMVREFSQSYAICLPSYYGEGVPKTLIEAAASGRAIVTTQTPGCQDVVKQGWNGFIVPPKDPHSLAKALQQLEKDPALCETMGKRGRERALKSFSLDQVIRETFAIYEELQQ